MADFGIAKGVKRTERGSGSGTLGYMAPEQAFGRTSFRGDVFTAALLIWRLLSGQLPDWPFEKPLVGVKVLRRRVPAELVDILHRCLSVEPKKRFRDAGAFLEAWEAVLPAVERTLKRQKRARR